MTDRKPDYVFNVWGDGLVEISEWVDCFEDAPASTLAVDNKCIDEPAYRITHRIRVFMKDKRS